MKLGSKSNLISAYTALFTVAFGVLIFDFVRRSAHQPEQQPRIVHRVPAHAETPKSGSLAFR